MAMATSPSFLSLLCLVSLLGCAFSAPNRGHAHAHPHPRSHARRGVASGPYMAACRTTPYPQMCYRILASSAAPPTAPLNRQIAAVSSFALRLTSSSYKLARHLASIPSPRSAPRTYRGALQDCIDLMSNTMDQLRLSITRLSALNTKHGSLYTLRSQLMDAQVSLSASFTFQDTCSGELHQRHVSAAAAAQLLKQVGDTSRAVTVALSLADTLHHRIEP